MGSDTEYKRTIMVSCPIDVFAYKELEYRKWWTAEYGVE